MEYADFIEACQGVADLVAWVAADMRDMLREALANLGDVLFLVGSVGFVWLLFVVLGAAKAAGLF